MNDSAKIKYFPKKNLKAYDGMSVTAEIWETAHSEHRDELRSHILSMHKPGIICGLEIKANDPADHYVFISPGAAVDELGRVIVVDQTIAYDFGDEGAGTYMLLLGYAEHEKENSETKVKWMQHEYIIAARQSLPKQSVIELARITISAKGALIRNARDPFKPGKDELDLRHRDDNPYSQCRICIGAVTIPSDNDAVYQGWRVLATEMERILHINLVVDMLPAIDERINLYDMIYIGAAGAFQTTDTQLALLKNYNNNGKGILMEGLDSEGGKALKAVGDSFKLEAVDPDRCSLFQRPFFFRIPPDQISEKHLFRGKRIILCTDPITSAWSGELDGEFLPRQDIRTNLEWGANLVTYCAG